MADMENAMGNGNQLPVPGSHHDQSIMIQIQIQVHALGIRISTNPIWLKYKAKYKKEVHVLIGNKK